MIEQLDALALRLSLAHSAGWWTSTLKRSILVSPILSFFDFADGKLPEMARAAGSRLQQAAFVVSILLFGVIGLPQFANDKSVLALATIGALALWIVGRMAGGKERRAPDAIDYIVLLYLGINVISACASHYLMPSLKGLAKMIVYIGSYFLFTSVVWGDSKRKITLALTVVASGLALSLYGLYQFKTGVAPLATWEDPSVIRQGTRIYSTLGNPNLLAGFLVPIAPLSFCLSIGFFARKTHWAGIILLGIGAIISLATVLTGSRGGYIGLFAGVGALAFILTVWLWKTYKKARIIIALAIVALSAISFFVLSKVPSFQQRVASMFAGREHSSNSYRLNVWTSSLHMLADNWWIGIGIGNEAFRLAYGLYMVSGYDALGTYSVPLEIAVETGIPGLIVFVVLLIACMARAHMGFWSQEGSPLSRWLYAGIACALIGLLAHGVVDTVFYRPQIHLVFWLLLAFMVAPDRVDTADKGNK